MQERLIKRNTSENLHNVASHQKWRKEIRPLYSKVATSQHVTPDMKELQPVKRPGLRHQRPRAGLN